MQLMEIIGNQLESNREINPQTGCWNWKLGKTLAGYGQIYIGSNPFYVHRVSAAIHLGFDLNSDLIVCHTCDNPSCFNPGHLYVGTDKTNQEDRAEKITHCINGHEFTSENTYIATNAKYPKRQCRRCKADREKQRREKLASFLKTEN